MSLVISFFFGKDFLRDLWGCSKVSKKPFRVHCLFFLGFLSKSK